MARTKSKNAPNTEDELFTLFDKLQRAVTNVLLNSGGLAIKTGGSALVKTANVIHALVDGAQITKAASDMAALSGTVTNAKFNVFVFTINAAGTLKSYMGTEGATYAAVTFPTIADGEVVIGYVSINPTGTGNFVGGTTALDDATVVPTAVYVNTPCVFANFCNPL
ncbi:MAG TPA: hypothetical protein VNG73_08970 [Gemmatimonadaceae bacterium]|nr:hypothetical protein [Gemmatimonadaceae bacterium]